MKKVIAILALCSMTAFANVQTRVICGTGHSSNPNEALSKANDNLNRKLETGVSKIHSVSAPVFTSNTGTEQNASICVTVIAESFSDLVL